MVRYEDTTNLTTQLELIISDPTDNTVYFDEIFTNETHNVNLFNYAWNYAVNASSYNVWVVVTSESKSTYYFKQYLLGMYDKASNPFDFGFMGSINGLDTAIFIPAFIIIAAAGCFNQMNAEIAAFLTTIIAIVLAAIGWITISSSMLVVALSLSILAGIVTARRFGLDHAAQWELLLGFFIINLSVGLVMGLALPGTETVSNGPSINGTQYQEQFNATRIVKLGRYTLQWHTYYRRHLSGFTFMWQYLQYILNGPPNVLTMDSANLHNRRSGIQRLHINIVCVGGDLCVYDCMVPNRIH